MNYSPLLRAFNALAPHDRPDALALAIRRDGRQHLHLINKHDAGLAMDCRWLADPDKPGDTHDFLASLAVIHGPVEPVGYGVITIDFDAHKIVSAQSYRMLNLFTADEFGHHAHCGPFWTDWCDVIKAAFEHNAIATVRYAHQGGNFSNQLRALDVVARSNWTQALRSATSKKPYGFVFRGFDFCPPLWQIETVAMVPGNASLVGDRAFLRLMRNGWECATRSVWCGHSFC